MILGLEGVHTVSTGVVINDLGSYPRFRCEQMPGLRSLPEMDYIEDKLIGRLGTATRAQEGGGKTITYQGDLQAESLPDLLELVEDLGHALPLNELLTVTSAPAAGYGGPSLPTRWFYARPIAVDIATEYPRTINTRRRGYELPASVVLRLEDPRYYHPDDVDESGGLSVAVDNTGRADTEAIITISGEDMDNVTLTNVTLGRSLVLEDLVAISGNIDEIVIDSRRRTIKRGNGDNLYSAFDPLNSTWWDRGVPFIATGAQTIEVSGAGTSGLQIQFYPADYV